MKRKMSIILLSFLAFGAFGAMHNANNDFNAPTKLVEAEDDVLHLKILTVTGWHGDRFARVDFESWNDPTFRLDWITSYTVENFGGENPYTGSFNVPQGDPATATSTLFQVFDYEPDVASYKFTINYRYNGNDTGDIRVADAEYFEVRNVAKPTNVRIEDGKILFDANPIAERHSLQYLKGTDGDERVGYIVANVKSGDELRTDLDAGTYRIQVRAEYGDKTSEWEQSRDNYQISAEGAEQLKAPTNVHVVDGKLEFDNIDENAAYYLVEYLKDDSVFATERAEKSPFELNKELKAGTYTIRLTAMNGDEDVDFYPSESIVAPETFEVEYVAVKLTITLRAYYGGNYATIEFKWDDPEFSLRGEIGDDGYYTVKGSSSASPRESRFFAWFDGEGNKAGNFEIGDDGSQDSYEFCFYNAEGMLVATGVLYNEAPEKEVQLTKPEGLVISASGYLEFAPVSNAKGFLVEYRKDDVVKYTQRLDVNAGQLNPDNAFAAGVYDIYVKALGDGDKYLDSEFAFAGQFVIARNYDVEANEFIARWRSLFNGSSICDALATRLDEVKTLIAEYDALDAEVKAIVDVAELRDLGIEDTFETHMKWAKEVVDVKDTTGNSLTNSLLTSLNDSSALSMAAILVGLSTLAFTGYFFISKRKLEK